MQTPQQAAPAGRRFPREALSRTSLAFVGLAFVAFVALLYLGRQGTFYFDEWYLVSIPGIGSFDDWMRPWGAHWVMVPMILWKSVFAVFGLSTYLPYLVLVLTAHVAAATALFILIRRSSGAFIAILSAALLLLLGSGYYNLFWGFQITFVASTAFGLWAIVAFDNPSRRGCWTLGAVLLMASVASSAVGVAYLAAVGVELLVDRRRRRAVLWLVPVGLVFAAWFLLWGRAGAAELGLTSTSDPLTVMGALVLAPPVMLDAITGLGAAVSWLVYLLLILVGTVAAVRRWLPPRALGAAAGLTFLILLVAIGRGALGVAYIATEPRYVYEGAAFMLIGASALLGRRGATRPATPADGALVAAIVLLATATIAFNVWRLPGGAQFFADQAGVTRGIVKMIDRYGAERLADPPPPPIFATYIPPPSDLEVMMARWGRLDRDSLRPNWRVPPTPEQMDRALWLVSGGTVQPTKTSLSPVGEAPTIIDASGRGITTEEACLVVTGEGSVAIRTRTPVLVEGAGSWTIGLGRDAPPKPGNELQATIGDGGYSVGVPTLGDGAEYRLVFHTPQSGGRVCSLPPG